MSEWTTRENMLGRFRTHLLSGSTPELRRTASHAAARLETLLRELQHEPLARRLRDKIDTVDAPLDTLFRAAIIELGEAVDALAADGRAVIERLDEAKKVSEILEHNAHWHFRNHPGDMQRGPDYREGD